jgi:threonine aldolase
LEALLQANAGHDLAYGEDRWTQKACDLFREVFETDCEVFFVFNGTAANALSVAQMCRPYYSVICHEHAHMETDECGAPEFFSNGAKLLLAGGDNGKLDPASVERIVTKRSDIHYPKPRMLSLTQATELGTSYSRAHLRELKEVALKHNLRVHMDGARFANAVTELGLSPKALSWQCGVDVLCLGGTKNGLAVGDAVIFFNKELAEDFDYRCKQAGQLASKMRFLAAPWVGLLRDDVWLKNARHSNECARALEEGLRGLPGVTQLFPREANSLFLKLSDRMATGLKERGWRFYTFIGAGGARFMCSWDTAEQSLARLVGDFRELASCA